MAVRVLRLGWAAAWLGAALMASLGGVAAAEAAAGGCPWEPLQVRDDGLYARLGGNATSCAEFSPGCPWAVPVPEFSGFVNCIASSSDCVQMNKKMSSVAISPPKTCSACSIKACEACVHDEQTNATRCARCFDGFGGQGGEKGRWEQCELWYKKPIFKAATVLLKVIVLVLVLAVVTTCLGAWNKDLLSRLTMQHHPVEGLRSPLVGSQEKNRDAIAQGFLLSFMSSIKYSSRRLQALRHKAKNAKDGGEAGDMCKSLPNDDVEKQLVDIGLGLQLFFNTQRFLICVAIVIWLAATGMKYSASSSAPSSASDFLDVRWSSLERVLHLSEAKLKRTRAQGDGCLLLWAVLLVMSWCFHLYQTTFVDYHDKRTQSAEDYTVRLEGLPPSMTSERELKRLLEQELRMEGLIHGVCICYNVLDLPEPECVEAMVDRLTELDDLDLGLYGEYLSTPRQDLLEQLADDSKQLQTWLNDGTLHGSGTAYVVFRKQHDLARLTAERRGIVRRVFEKPADTAEGSDKNCNDSELKVVKIIKDNAEPSGVRFENFTLPQKRHRRNTFVGIPLRMVLYIGLYAGAAHLYFLFMVKPWEDNFIEGETSDWGVWFGGKLVLLLNVGIQTLVMMDVERGGFLRTAEVDSITFVWNTVLLLVTNFFVVMQEVYRDGYYWLLTYPKGCVAEGQPSDSCWEWLHWLFKSVFTEREVGKNLVSLLQEQIQMLYLVGEAANVLMPVIFYWVALRLIYVRNVGGSTNSWFQRTLRAILPSSASPTTVTAREAEKAQVLMPLLLWMEYTYIVIFPAMTLVTFYLVTDDTSNVCMWLIIFSLISYGWQRYVMLWMYGKATYDSELSYEAFIFMWGLVLSMLPPAWIWWAFRRGEVQELGFALLSMALVFMLSLLVYRYGLVTINWYLGSREDGVDDMAGGDPGYSSIVDQFGISWWNRNPVYVLKNRHCPDLPGHEVHDREVQCWPAGCAHEGFFELGKEFRHLHQCSQEMESPLRSLRQMLFKRDEQRAAESSAAACAAPESEELPPPGPRPDSDPSPSAAACSSAAQEVP